MHTDDNETKGLFVELSTESCVDVVAFVVMFVELSTKSCVDIILMLL